ncbi:hypothetical protein [Rhodomicrobium lacus]|uniref:hypothetical protein n=1 Tax=Rhodomicrobium lacus TaxID=2498452 RepID=UPI000F8EE484|nr:hypothetical protein [Rhodomicrobium lacus]
MENSLKRRNSHVAAISLAVMFGFAVCGPAQHAVAQSPDSRIGGGAPIAVEPPPDVRGPLPSNPAPPLQVERTPNRLGAPPSAAEPPRAGVLAKRTPRSQRNRVRR